MPISAVRTATLDLRKRLKDVGSIRDIFPLNFTVYHITLLQEVMFSCRYFLKFAFIFSAPVCSYLLLETFSTLTIYVQFFH